MLYVYRSIKFPDQRLLIGAKDGVQAVQRLVKLLKAKSGSWGVLSDWKEERTLDMVDWAVWVY